MGTQGGTPDAGRRRDEPCQTERRWCLPQPRRACPRATLSYSLHRLLRRDLSNPVWASTAVTSPGSLSIRLLGDTRGETSDCRSVTVVYCGSRTVNDCTRLTVSPPFSQLPSTHRPVPPDTPEPLCIADVTPVSVGFPAHRSAAPSVSCSARARHGKTVTFISGPRSPVDLPVTRWSTGDT